FSWGQEPKIMGRKTVGAVLGIGSIEGYVFEDTNRDGLMSPGEKGLAGVSLRLEDGSRAMTGEDGRYRFPMVAEGPHQVQIEENLIPAMYYLLSPARVDVLTQARITREVSFPLISGASLNGRFIEDSDRNGAMDPADKGLADILVILTPIDGAAQKDLILNTYTDAGGVYRFVNILPGEYELSVDPETLPAGAVTAVPLPFKIKLEPGRTAGGVDFLVIPRPVIRKK
ncbi:MAG TPA: SdrD B-like domain-containing protein, partial [Candidatus Aminicenantes bacterium]|nr:SdrD B-like domain-containing protein [Candidatus Aminicenantes bacterium]